MATTARADHYHKRHTARLILDELEPAGGGFERVKPSLAQRVIVHRRGYDRRRSYFRHVVTFDLAAGFPQSPGSYPRTFRRRF